MTEAFVSPTRHMRTALPVRRLGVRAALTGATYGGRATAPRPTRSVASGCRCLSAGFTVPAMVLLLSTSPPAQDLMVPYVYQLTAYLENTFMPGAWWANPALLAEIDSRVSNTSTRT